jgi:hypothetical protein
VIKGGIKTLADLHSRCVLDDETDCLVFTGIDGRRVSNVWMRGHGSVSVVKAMRLLTLGDAPEGLIWSPRCLNMRCCKREHWRLTTRSEQMRAIRPSLTPDHRAAIAVSVRASRGKVGHELAEKLRASTKTLSELAAETGLDRSTISNVRRGSSWGLMRAASVFAWRP